MPLQDQFPANNNLPRLLYQRFDRLVPYPTQNKLELTLCYGTADITARLRRMSYFLGSKLHSIDNHQAVVIKLRSCFHPYLNSAYKELIQRPIYLNSHLISESWVLMELQRDGYLLPCHKHQNGFWPWGHSMHNSQTLPLGSLGNSAGFWNGPMETANMNGINLAYFLGDLWASSDNP